MVSFVEGISKFQMAITLLVSGWIAIGFLVKEVLSLPPRLTRVLKRVKNYLV